MKDVSTVISPPLSMGIFAYPHREGARLTLEILLGKMDGEETRELLSTQLSSKNGILSPTCEQCIEKLKTNYPVTILLLREGAHG